MTVAEPELHLRSRMSVARSSTPTARSTGLQEGLPSNAEASLTGS